MRTLLLIAVLAGCTDFKFADDLECSGLGNCPPGYFCDPGGDVCRVDLGGCGNGTLDPGEVCDDSNRTTGDGCRADCLKAEICGDGERDPQEGCDDGNTVGGDGCAADCRVEGCGDGVLDIGEQCDDGAANGIGARCLPTCVVASCGDGFVRPGLEVCDDGAANGDTAACLSTCVVATCGDGHAHAGIEACDDGNGIETDGCLGNCHLATCGDANVQVGVELCDDGNTIDGDGCNNDCTTSKVIQVVAGLDHTCILRAGGKVRCWGQGGQGALGHGVTANLGDVIPPALAGDIDLGGNAIQLAAGDSHTCALLDTGKVRCWGVGANGRLGYGNTTNIGDDETPASAGDVAVGGTVIQIAAGSSHTCALLATGAVRCWGAGGAGRLGYGNTTTIGDNELPSTAGDVAVGGTVKQIVAGGSHTCALLDTGKVRCWGAGVLGRLGYGNTTNIGDDELPSSAGDVAIGGTVVELAAGQSHTCARLDTGKVRCWGSGADGRLGYGNTTTIGDNELPSTAGDIDLGGNAVQIGAGDAHSCALLDTGTIRCWGAGTNGRLGYISTETIGDDEPPSSHATVKLGITAVRISVGQSHTCVLTITGDVRCWGSGADGRLGYGGTGDVGDTEAPSDAGDVFVMGAAKQISVGAFHTCALSETGAVRCWGLGETGQLGYGNTSSIGDNEFARSGGDIDLGGTAVQIAAGGAHSCALLDTGKVRCWGFGAGGRLGYGNQNTIGDDETPATAGDVDVGGTVTQIVAGESHTCALLDTGNVRCWGTGSFGKLGYGNTNDIGDDETPASAGDVDIGGPVLQITAGANHTCALLASRLVRCWGFGGDTFGGDGRLGYGNTITIGDNETPASAGDVPLGGTVQQIVATDAHTCAVLGGGRVKCWGEGGQGRTGHGNQTDIGDDETAGSAPDVVVGGLVVQLSVGANNTCALLTTGNVRCWGMGFRGRTGYGNQLDIGDDENPATAGDISIGGPVAEVSTGNLHSCARLATGKVRCWGGDLDGQLGHGNTDNIGDVLPPSVFGDVPLF